MSEDSVDRVRSPRRLSHRSTPRSPAVLDENRRLRETVQQQAAMMQQMQQQIAQLMGAPANLSLVQAGGAGPAAERAAESFGLQVVMPIATPPQSDPREELLREAAGRIIRQGQAVAHATVQARHEEAQLAQRSVQLTSEARGAESRVVAQELDAQSRILQAESQAEAQMVDAQVELINREQLAEMNSMADRQRLQSKALQAQIRVQEAQRQVQAEAVNLQAAEAQAAQRVAEQLQRATAQAEEAEGRAAAKIRAAEAAARNGERELERREHEIRDRERASSSVENNMLQKLLSRMDAYGVQMAEFKQELVDMRQGLQSCVQTQKVAGSSSEEDSGSGSDSESKLEFSPSTLGNNCVEAQGGQGSQQGQLLPPRRTRRKTLTRLRVCQGGPPLLAMQCVGCVGNSKGSIEMDAGS